MVIADDQIKWKLAFCHLLRDIRDGEIRESWLHVQQIIYVIRLVWQPRDDIVAST
jgi:hypothetical protein